MNTLFHIPRTFLMVGDDMFEIHRIFPDKPYTDVDSLKKYFNVDRVFRKDDKLYFCFLVKEAVIIEENGK